MRQYGCQCGRFVNPLAGRTQIGRHGSCAAGVAAVLRALCGNNEIHMKFTPSCGYYVHKNSKFAVANQASAEYDLTHRP